MIQTTRRQKTVLGKKLAPHEKQINLLIWMLDAEKDTTILRRCDRRRYRPIEFQSRVEEMQRSSSRC
jgi:hypothetical protein